MNLTKMKKLLSLLLVLAMIVGMLPVYQTSAAADETAASVTVTFSAEDGTAFFVEPMTVTVTDGLAESYGFTVPEKDHNGKEITAPTFLDALIAVQKALYGDKFTAETVKDYMTMSGSMILTAFGKNASASLMTVNGVTPNDGIYNENFGSYTGYTCDTAQLKDGDELGFHLLRDSMWMDYYASFTDDVETAFTGADVTLSLSGYSAGWYGSYPQDTIDAMTENICGADISYRKSGDTEWTNAGKTDENGVFSVSFPEAGLYEVMASGNHDGDYGEAPIMAAWKTVYVYDKTSVDVVFSVQNGSYVLEPMKLTVTDGLAEEYGYDVSAKDHNGEYITAPTIFDALVAVHKALDTEGTFTAETAKDSLTISGGWLATAFGKGAGNVMVSVDGVTANDGILGSWGYTGYAMDAAQLKDGADVQFNYIQDTANWGDYYTYVTSAENVYAGEEMTLQAYGYAFMMNGCSPAETIAANTVPMKGVTVSYKEAGAEAGTFEKIGETDENGAVKMTFDKPGTYIVSVSGMMDGTPVMTCWHEVTVTEKPVTWQSFGGNQNNMATSSVKTPMATDTVRAKWITDPLTQPMSGMGAPVIVNGAMYFQNEKYVTKLDVATGKILAQNTLAKACGYGPSGVAYGDGQIFVAEAGTVEAFDAETLERTWIYEDAVGGQSYTNVYYRDGYVYTGFYQTDAAYNKIAANYVCIDAAAADGAKKDAVWTYAGNAGFYWAGAYANDKYVVFGGEAATGAETSKVTVLDRMTGSLVSEAEVLGNVRSDVSYSEETGKLYFTSDAGYLYEAALSEDGVITLTQTITLGGKSTSTPVVHNGKAYVGVSGANQFGTEGHAVKVVNLESGTINYEVPMNGYPQCTLLLSDAYEEETGKVYLYATENCASGVVKVIADSEGQTKAEAYDLYTAADGLKQYCTASIVCDEDGTLYYSNDTGRIFALTAKKLEYTLGDVDADGDVDASDALLTLKIVVKLQIADDRMAAAADVNTDGEIKAEDALEILKYVVKLIDGFTDQKN